MAYSEIDCRNVRVRKERGCEWCWEKIEKGQSAAYRVYKFEGELNRGWMHPECKEAMEKSKWDYVCDGWTPGDFERGKCA